jgi:hypothetical protein
VLLGGCPAAGLSMSAPPCPSRKLPRASPLVSPTTRPITHCAGWLPAPPARRWIPTKERSRSLAFVYSGMFVGSIIGLGASPHIVGALGWPSVFYMFGSLGVIWCAGWRAGWQAGARAGRACRTSGTARSSSCCLTYRVPLAGAAPLSATNRRNLRCCCVGGHRTLPPLVMWPLRAHPPPSKRATHPPARPAAQVHVLAAQRGQHARRGRDPQQARAGAHPRGHARRHRRPRRVGAMGAAAEPPGGVGAHRDALLPQLGPLHPADVDAGVLQPGAVRLRYRGSTTLVGRTMRTHGQHAGLCGPGRAVCCFSRGGRSGAYLGSGALAGQAAVAQGSAKGPPHLACAHPSPTHAVHSVLYIRSWAWTSCPAAPSACCRGWPWRAPPTWPAGWRTIWWSGASPSRSCARCGRCAWARMRGEGRPFLADGPSGTC